MIYVCHLNRIDIDRNFIYACSIYVIYFEYFVLTYVHSIHMCIYIYTSSIRHGMYMYIMNIYVYISYILDIYLRYFVLDIQITLDEVVLLDRCLSHE